jgi:EmrB/QacA subfamily drug resistance transporter
MTNERPKAGWLPMIFIGMGVALIIMDATIVNVILPAIITDLQINSIDAEWVNAVYALSFAALLIVMGRLGDRYGRRRIFLVGALVFLVASILAALASSGAVLILARAIQGIGAAMMSPTSLALINDNYRGKSRAIAFAIYGSLIGGFAAIGPVLGGWLTQTFSWHWSFFINIPIALLIIVGTLRLVPESKAHGDTGSPDLPGAVLSTVGIAALIFALIEGRNYGWVKVTAENEFLGRALNVGDISPVFIAYFISALALVALFLFETSRTKRGQSALIDFRLFKIKTFGLGSFAALIVSLGEFGILFSLPLFMQSVLGWTSLGAGSLLATLALGAFIAAPSAAAIAIKRNPRFVARLGLILEFVGILGLASTISPTTSGWVLALWLLIYGLGVGYAQAQLTGLIMSEVPDAQTGQASGTQSTARQIGAALGTAILGTVLFTSLQSATTTQLTMNAPYLTPEAAAPIAHSVQDSAGLVIPGLAAAPGSPEIQAAAEQGFATAISLTAFTAAAFIGLGLIATLRLPKGRVRGSEPAQDELIQSFE